MEDLLKRLKELKRDITDISFQKALYKYYVESNYSDKCFEFLEDELIIKASILKEVINVYSRIDLKMNDEEFEKFKVKEKKKRNELYLGKINPILSMYGYDTMFLWKNEEQKETFLHEIYNYAKSNDFKISSSKDMAKRIGITPSKYLELVDMYIKEYLDKDPKEITSKEAKNQIEANNKRYKNKKKRDLYQSIINAVSLNEIVNIIDNSSYTYTVLRTDFRLYEKFYSKSEVEKFYKAISDYMNNRKKQQKINEEIQKANRLKEARNNAINVATEIVTKYLNSDNISFFGFLNENNLTEEKFNSYVEKLKNNNEELYNKFQKLRTLKMKQSMKVEYDQLKEVSEKMNTGYIENDTKRNFDIIDYLLITRIPLSLAAKKAERLGCYSSELKRFAFLNMDADKYSKTEYNIILSEKRLVGFKTDKNGRLIEGSGREITDNEKENLISYLNENNIPINRFTYKAALKRYLDGFINFSKKAKKLTNKK